MTDPTRIPQPGDVIMSREPTAWGHSHAVVDVANMEHAKTLVRSGRWVIVEPKVKEEQVG